MSVPPNTLSEHPASAPEKGSNFYLGFLFLSKRRREALAAVYAYCRCVDDIVDSGELKKEDARAQLDFWREEIVRLYAGAPTHALSRNLLPFVEEFNLPQEGFSELIEGMAMDLEKNRYETIADLERYLFGAAGTVGLLCVELFGYAHTSPEDIRAYAIEMGNAMQLTNILRDVGTDLEQGRIYLPQADIREAQYSVQDLIARKHTPAFTRLMEREGARAREYFRKARSLLHPSDAPSMLPAEVMAHIYEDVLARIEAERYRVFFQRIRVPLWKKSALALRAWMLSRGIF